MNDEVELFEVEEGNRHKYGKLQVRRSKDGKQKFPGGSIETEDNHKVSHDSEKPSVGMIFVSEEAAKSFYDAYARRVGFSTHVGQCSHTKPDGPIISWNFSCSREVYKRKNVESCNAMLQIEKEGVDRWVVTKFVEDHNHSMVSPSKVHYLRPKRHFAGAKKILAETVTSQIDAIVPADGNNAFSDSNVGSARSASPVEKICTTRNLSLVAPRNFLQPCSLKRTLGRDAHNLLNYFKKMQAENPGFFYAIQLDDDNRMSNVFWADARSRMAYGHFGDAVMFDTMYRPNQYQVPFASFTGVNHHGHMVLFGCALIFDESESSFAWIFKTWLSAMGNCPPVSMTTDQDRAIKTAVNQVLPETCHCICKWHILREGQERLAHIYLADPSFYGELYNCIIFSETIEDFESSWSSLLDKYDVRKNEWLQAVYNARKQWAPVYFRGTFFAAISSNHGMSSFLDGYVNQHTTLPFFFQQYERALENALEREIEADFDTICTKPLLKTPSPMEQQVGNLYTKKIFAKFQEELVETFVYTANKIDGDGVVSKFRVAKYEHDDKAFTVTLNVSDMKASCSCQMFEYSGILCRHVLTVFTVTNVLKVPPNYILKRWTRQSRVELLSDDYADTQCVETLTLRFSNLCREAFKYAEEGAVSSETYNAAMAALREGARKISAMKENVAKVKPSISQNESSGTLIAENNKKTSGSTSTCLPSCPWQDMIPQHVNLNGVGVPLADLNHPSLSPLATNSDSAHADNTVRDWCGINFYYYNF